MRVPAYICAPYRGDVRENTTRATRLAMWAVAKGYAPIVPHLQDLVYLGAANPGQTDELAVECGVILAKAVAQTGGWMFVVERDDGTLSAGCEAEVVAFRSVAGDWTRMRRCTWANWLESMGGGQ